MKVTLPAAEVIVKVEDATITMKGFGAADVIEVRTGTKTEQLNYILSKIVKVEGVTLEDGTPLTVDQVRRVPDLGVAIFAGYLSQMTEYFETESEKKRIPSSEVAPVVPSEQEPQLP